VTWSSNALYKTRQLALIFPNIVPQCHIFRGAHPGGYDPQIRTRPRFLYNASTPKFYHHMFTRSEVIVLTNRRCWTHPTLFTTLLQWLITYDWDEKTQRRIHCNSTELVCNVFVGPHVCHSVLMIHNEWQLVRCTWLVCSAGTLYHPSDTTLLWLMPQESQQRVYNKEPEAGIPF